MKPPLQSLVVQKRRKRAKRLHWTARSRYRQAVVRRVLHLPTRRTLTYAEAQQFVDICVNGSVSRLNVLEPLHVVDDCDGETYDSECCNVSLPSETNIDVGSGLYEHRLDNSRQVHVLSSAATAAGVGAMPLRPAAYYRHIDQTPQELGEEVEYDTDEQVCCFLAFILIAGTVIRCQDDPNGSPPENWKKPSGRPHITWMNSVQQDLRAGIIS